MLRKVKHIKTEEDVRILQNRLGHIPDNNDDDIAIGYWFVAPFGNVGIYYYDLVSEETFNKWFTLTGKELKNGFLEAEKLNKPVGN